MAVNDTLVYKYSGSSVGGFAGVGFVVGAIDIEVFKFK